jgi:hypothetical protein
VRQSIATMCHSARWAFTFFLSWVAWCGIARAEGLVLHVSGRGNDAWSGKLAEPTGNDGPFLTLERARNEIRKLKQAAKLPSGEVAVEIQGGVYDLKRPLELTSEDSGAAGAPIVYRAKPGQAVHIRGGVEVTNFQPVTDAAVLQRLDESARGKVLQANLKTLGVQDLGKVIGGNRLEVFFNDKPMTLARWPNEGFVQIVDVVGGEPFDIRGNLGDRIGRFTYDGDRPGRWIHEKDVWLHGYWFWDWAAQRQQVASIDTAKRTISIAPPYHDAGYRKGQWYYAFNLLPELDSPGEWYLDRAAGILYFWPPAEGKTTVSVIPSLVTMHSVSHVAVRGLTLELCRDTALRSENGNDVRVAACTIRNTGDSAVSLSGKESSVEGCDIYGTAGGGIGLHGGDRKTLTPANLAADNNHIHDYSRWERLCRPAVSLGGIGNRATHNLIHDAPHQAIGFEGNDHLVEFNEIHSVCFESNDAGALYAGRNWTERGHVIRYNYLHDITGFRGKGCVGIYLDDQFACAEIFGNLFYKVTSAAFIGGGRDNAVVNNIFVDCKPAVHFDARGLNWCSIYFDRMKHGLDEVPYQTPPWSTRYPKLVNILNEKPMAPVGNVIARNIFVNPRWIGTEPDAKPYLHPEDNLIGQDPHFVDAEHLNFQLKEDSPAYKLGFQKIPIEKMGLYASPNRASWPVQHAVRPVQTTKGTP